MLRVRLVYHKQLPRCGDIAAQHFPNRRLSIASAVAVAMLPQQFSRLCPQPTRRLAMFGGDPKLFWQRDDAIDFIFQPRSVVRAES